MIPEFLLDINAKTGLETPQIVLEWEFEAGVETPLTEGVPWLWDNLYIRRSDYRFPEDISEGTVILSESYSSNPTVNLGDITSLIPFKYYYYSFILEYTTHSASPLLNEFDISRLGTNFYSECQNAPEVLLTGTDATTNVGSPIVTIPAPVAPALGFIGSEVEAGFIFEVDDGGIDDGFYEILSVDSDTQITLTSNLGAATVATCDYNVYSNHEKVWILTNKYERTRVLYRYDTGTGMVDYKIDPSAILDDNEEIEAIAHAGQRSVGEIGIVTNYRYISIPMYNETPTTADVINEWDLDMMVAGYRITGAAYYYSAPDDFILILDSNNLEYVVINEATGIAVGNFDVSALDEVTQSTLCGISIIDGTGIVLLGNRNYVYMFNGFINPTSADVVGVVYTRYLITNDFYVGLDSLLSFFNHIGCIL